MSINQYNKIHCFGSSKHISTNRSNGSNGSNWSNGSNGSNESNAIDGELLYDKIHSPGNTNTVLGNINCSLFISTPNSSSCFPISTSR